MSPAERIAAVNRAEARCEAWRITDVAGVVAEIRAGIEIEARRIAAVERGYVHTIALCDVAVGDPPDDYVLLRLPTEVATRVCMLTYAEARHELGIEGSK